MRLPDPVALLHLHQREERVPEVEDTVSTASPGPEAWGGVRDTRVT